MTLRVWGIGSCDGCRRARRWLEQQGLEYRWTDLRESPPDAERLASWLDALGGDALLNRRSTTWRGLDQAEREAAFGPRLIALLQRHPTLIKRPLIESGNRVRVGFDNAVRRWLQPS